MVSARDSYHSAEVQAGRRFRFGDNWTRFLNQLTEVRIGDARTSLMEMLDVETLRGKSFLDVGSGSGLFSLAARILGASVRSFDYDPNSVRCTLTVKQRFLPEDPEWIVEEGSILDDKYISTFGVYDVVYSWGVLHHTGDMYKAFDTIALLVKPNGMLFIAIYNDQGWLSKYWRHIKRLYNRNAFYRLVVIAIHAPYLIAFRYLVRIVTRRSRLERGMSLWYDMLDWLGGYPFEVAKPEHVFSYFKNKGFRLEKLRMCGGRMGCNEFVFSREDVVR